jgi:putative sterol carrier protein
MSSGLLVRPKWMNQEVYDSINKNIKDGDELIKDLLDSWIRIRAGSVSPFSSMYTIESLY